MRNGVRLSPYVPGAQGTAIGTFLAGKAPLAAAPETPETRFVELSGAAFNTIYPNDFGYWEIVNELVQQEPPEAADPELLGLLAAVGIVTASRSSPTRECARSSKRRSWSAAPPPAPSRSRHDLRKVSPSTRTRRGRARSSSAATSSSTRRRSHRRRRGRGPERRCPQAQLPHQLLLHGHRHHTGDVHAPHRHRLAVHLRDARQPRRVPRRRPRLPPHASARHSREPVLVGDPLRPPDPLHAANGSTPASPRQPIRHRRDRTPTARPTSTSARRRRKGRRHNWLQTVPGKGWWTILRLYNPLQPFFDKSWRPSEIELLD